MGDIIQTQRCKATMTPRFGFIPGRVLSFD